MLGLMLIMSIVTFAAYGHDKRAAKLKRRRIPEKTLFLLNCLGGWTGGWLGMYLFRHKTKHKSFYAVQFLSALVWCCALVYVMFYS